TIRTFPAPGTDSAAAAVAGGADGRAAATATPGITASTRTTTAPARQAPGVRNLTFAPKRLAGPRAAIIGQFLLRRGSRARRPSQPRPAGGGAPAGVLIRLRRKADAPTPHGLAAANRGPSRPHPRRPVDHGKLSRAESGTEKHGRQDGIRQVV